MNEFLNQRDYDAYHEAGHAVMALLVGGKINHEGVEIDARQYCGARFAPHDQEHRELMAVLWCLGGRRAEQIHHHENRKQGWLDGDRGLEDAIYEAHVLRQNDEASDDDDIGAFTEMLRLTPDASDEHLLRRYNTYSDACLSALWEPPVWDSVTRVANALVQHGHLYSDDVEKYAAPVACSFLPRFRLDWLDD